MTEPSKRRFVAYRQTADEVRVRFVGGPLDGASFLTDEWPNTKVFIHRVGSRDYRYFYRQVTTHEFIAAYCGNTPGNHEITGEVRRKRHPGRTRRMLAIYVACIVAWLLAIYGLAYYCQG